MRSHINCTRLMIFAALGAVAHAQVGLTDVGSLPGQNGSLLWGASAAGGVGDAAALGDSTTHAVRWLHGGALEDLGELAGGQNYSESSGLSADGSVVVGMSRSANGPEAFRWTSAGGMVGLGDLPGGVFESHAVDVNADGTWTIGFASDSTGQRPVRWNAVGSVELLGALPGGNGVGHALDISPDGTAIVGTADAGIETWPFRWTPAGGMQHLGGSITDMQGGRAEGVSDDGQVVVGFAATSTFLHAFRYTVGGQMQELGYLPGGMFVATALDCSGDGSVVVGSNMMSSFGPNGPEFEATIWDTTNGLRSLEQVLVNDYGMNLAGFELQVATGISADGLTIVGHGYDSHVRLRGWVVKLPSTCAGVASFCTTSPNSSGAGAVLNYSGTTSLAANDLVLQVAGATPLQFGIFYYGPNQIAVPFGDGVRCVGGGTFRLPVLMTDASGAGSFVLDNTNPPQAGGQLNLDDLWNFQFWYRDPQQSGGSGFNLSDGLAVTICP